MIPVSRSSVLLLYSSIFGFLARIDRLELRYGSPWRYWSLGSLPLLHSQYSIAHQSKRHSTSLYPDTAIASTEHSSASPLRISSLIFSCYYYLCRCCGNFGSRRRRRLRSLQISFWDIGKPRTQAETVQLSDQISVVVITILRLQAILSVPSDGIDDITCKFLMHC